MPTGQGAGPKRQRKLSRAAHQYVPCGRRRNKTRKGIAEPTSRYEESRPTVESLIARIADNERVDRHYTSFEFKLLECSRLAEVLELLLAEAGSYFDLADTGLVLIDRDDSTRDLVDHLSLGDYAGRLLLTRDEQFAASLYAGGYRVVLSRPEARFARGLFLNEANLGSIALMPLLRTRNLIGSLHFGSRSAHRFTADKAVDFLSHLASIVAVCLDNSLAHERLRRQSRIDTLTQVSNRRDFEDEFVRELERSWLSDDPLSCLFVDIDHFKAINDLHGHPRGDACLREVAAAIGLQLQKADLLARYGGEEFVVALHRCDLDEAALIAERIRAGIKSLRIAADGAHERVPFRRRRATRLQRESSGRTCLRAARSKLCDRPARPGLYDERRAGYPARGGAEGMSARRAQEWFNYIQTSGTWLGRLLRPAEWGLRE